MSKDDQQIMAIEIDTLFSADKYFEGFKHHSEHDYENTILDNYKILRRGDLEIDPSHKQPIGYMMIVNPTTKQIYAYQRASKDEHYTETRLQGKWSWGVGGHVEPMDTKNGNPIKESRTRELSEEVHIDGNIKDIKILGYINDDSNEVGKVHFGILYLVEIDGTARPKDSEMFQGKMMHISELEELCKSPEVEVENWSSIAINPLKALLEK